MPISGCPAGALALRWFHREHERKVSDAPHWWHSADRDGLSLLSLSSDHYSAVARLTAGRNGSGQFSQPQYRTRLHWCGHLFRRSDGRGGRFLVWPKTTKQPGEDGLFHLYPCGCACKPFILAVLTVRGPACHKEITSMSTQEHFDLVILGSGSTAFAAALHAAELGKTVAMTEERTVGGTCANRGCLPSKNLIEAARLVYDAAHPRYPGLSPVHMPFSWAELVDQKDEIIHEYRAHKYESLLDDSDQVQVVPGQAHLVSDHEVEVQSADGVRRLIGEQILIATGSAPLIPNLPGLANVSYLTSDLLSSSDDPWGTELREQPNSLLILGGGYIALELGQMFARFGTQVTLVTRGSTILSGYEPEIAAALTMILLEEGLRIVTGAQVRGVRHEGEGVALSIQRHGSQQTLSAEKLLVATSRHPNTQELGLEQEGVELDQAGGVRGDRTLRTNSCPILAAGAVIGQ